MEERSCGSGMLLHPDEQMVFNWVGVEPELIMQGLQPELIMEACKKQKTVSVFQH